jgi:hypothetical protein
MADLQTALDTIRSARAGIEQKLEALRGEDALLEQAEEALRDVLMIGHPVQDQRAPEPTSEVTERERHVRTSTRVKAQILACIQGAGAGGVTRDQLSAQLPQARPTTISATLSLLKREGLVCARRAPAGRQRLWYAPNGAAEHRHPADPDVSTDAHAAVPSRPAIANGNGLIMKGRHGVSLPAISALSGRQTTN